MNWLLVKSRSWSAPMPMIITRTPRYEAASAQKADNWNLSIFARGWHAPCTCLIYGKYICMWIGGSIAYSANLCISLLASRKQMRDLSSARDGSQFKERRIEILQKSVWLWFDWLDWLLDVCVCEWVDWYQLRLTTLSMNLIWKCFCTRNII